MASINPPQGTNISRCLCESMLWIEEEIYNLLGVSPKYASNTFVIKILAPWCCPANACPPLLCNVTPPMLTSSFVHTVTTRPLAPYLTADSLIVSSTKAPSAITVFSGWLPEYLTHSNSKPLISNPYSNPGKMHHFSPVTRRKTHPLRSGWKR